MSPLSIACAGRWNAPVSTPGPSWKSPASKPTAASSVGERPYRTTPGAAFGITSASSASLRPKPCGTIPWAPGCRWPFSTRPASLRASPCTGCWAPSAATGAPSHSGTTTCRRRNTRSKLLPRSNSATPASRSRPGPGSTCARPSAASAKPRPTTSASTPTGTPFSTTPPTPSPSCASSSRPFQRSRSSKTPYRGTTPPATTFCAPRSRLPSPTITAPSAPARGWRWGVSATAGFLAAAFRRSCARAPPPPRSTCPSSCRWSAPRPRPPSPCT